MPCSNGGKWWRLKYRFGGREKRLSLGVYPDVDLKSARQKRASARQQLAAGVDPGEARKAERLAQAGAESFEAIAREWHAKFSPGWVANHGGRILRRFERDLFPWLGKRPIAEIKAPARGAAPDREPRCTGNRTPGDAELRAGIPLRRGDREHGA